MTGRLIRAASAAALALLATPAAAEWASAWIAAPFPAIPRLVERDLRTFENQTVRQFLRVAGSGDRLRLRLTNELGTKPVRFGEAHVAVVDAEGRLRPGSERILIFSGRRGASIAAGAPLLSDPVALKVESGDRLAVSIFYREPATPAAHLLEVQVASGNQAAAPLLASARTARAPALAAAVELWRSAQTPLIVAIGDSITEGAGSTPGAYRSWPDQLMDRFRANPRTRDWTVVNAGINGNRVLHNGAGANALARFDRDVLAVPGATHVILLEGINDIGWGSQKDKPQDQVSAEQLIGGYRQMIGRAHAKGLRICGGTLLPYRGAIYWSPGGEAKRQKVNRWIRTSGAFDCVIDFERAVADPDDPTRIETSKHPGDHLHPNDAGYAAMAASVDPKLFEPAQTADAPLPESAGGVGPPVAQSSSSTVWTTGRPE